MLSHEKIVESQEMISSGVREARSPSETRICMLSRGTVVEKLMLMSEKLGSFRSRKWCGRSSRKLMLE